MCPHSKWGLVCNNLSYISLYLHWWHVSSPKGGGEMPAVT